MKLFSGHFYGQSFIKTVRGPFHIHENNEDIRNKKKIVKNKRMYPQRYLHLSSELF